MAAGPYPVQAPGAAPALPLLVRIGDDWSIPVVLADSLGQPRDLTGSRVTARVYGPFPFDVAGPNGSVTVTTALEGGATVLVAREATGRVTPTAPFAKALPCCLSVVVVDTLGRQHTYDPIPLLPLRPQDATDVPTQVPTQVLNAFQQGPAGASNSLTAGQVTALVDAAVAAALQGVAGTGPAASPVPAIVTALIFG